MILAREVQSHNERWQLRNDQPGPVTRFSNRKSYVVRKHHFSSAVDKQIHNFFLLYQGPHVVVRVSSGNDYTETEPKTNRTIVAYNIIHFIILSTG